MFCHDDNDKKRFELCAKINNLIERNRNISWITVRPLLIDMCVALVPLQLPSYVLLEIFDWFHPDMHKTNRVKKVNLIVNIDKFYKNKINF